jgi:hypothetical protein
MLMPPIRTGRDAGEVHRPRLLGSLQPGRLPRRGSVVAVVRRDQLAGSIHLPLVEDGLNVRADDFLVAFH